MLEIEAKIKVDDLDLIARRLGELGGRFVAEQRQSDVYFCDADGTLEQRGCGLRLRSETVGDRTSAILTFKGARQDSVYKVRPEYETPVADGGAMTHILEGLGYRATLTVAKTRRMWELDGCEVCLDDVPPLGCFVEVEGDSAAAVKAALTRLGLADKPHVVEGYAALMAKTLAAR
jgi:adenylate cyclase class 2